jgi:hypothetical protein
VEKIIIAENFIRSAKAPTISAGVMIAKVIWNTKKRTSGMPPERVSPSTPLRKTLPKPPMNEWRFVTPAIMPVESKASE